MSSGCLLMSPSEEYDQMKIMPLGSGQEVGRSCHVVQFKDKKIMLDCGIHPGLTSMDALPFVDSIESDLSTSCSSHTSTWTTRARCPGSCRRPPSEGSAT